MNLLKPLIMSMVIVCTVTLMGCSKEAPKTEEIPYVMVAQPLTTLNEQKSYAGDVQARQQTALAFRVGGQVTARYVDVGDRVKVGQVLAKLGTIKPHSKFEAEIYVLSKEEGGRHTPFFSNYRPQFYFRTTDVTGAVNLPAGVEMVMPGDNTKFNVELITKVAMEKGLRFAIREGGRTIGAGTVANILD